MHVRVPAVWIRSLRVPACFLESTAPGNRASSLPPVRSLSSCVPAESKWWEASGGDGAARKMPARWRGGGTASGLVHYLLLLRKVGGR